LLYFKTGIYVVAPGVCYPQSVRVFNNLSFKIKVQTACLLHLSPYGRWPWQYYIFFPVIKDISMWRSFSLISFFFEATGLYEAVLHVQNSLN